MTAPAPMPPGAQVQQAFPKLATPIITPLDGIMTPSFRRLLMTLWQRTGGTIPIIDGVILESNGGGLPITARDATTGAVLGELLLDDQPGGSAAPQAPGAPPYVFGPAPKFGVLLIHGLQAIHSASLVEVSRDGTTYYPVNATGGQLVLWAGDFARLSWDGAQPPAVVWMPST